MNSELQMHTRMILIYLICTILGIKIVTHVLFKIFQDFKSLILRLDNHFRAYIVLMKLEKFSHALFAEIFRATKY